MLGYISLGERYCTNCAAGYINNGALGCSTCQPGSYSHSGDTSCTACPAGVYGSTAALTSSACTAACPANYYCPQGTGESHIFVRFILYCFAVSYTSYPCPANAFSPGSSTAITNCQCNAGTFGIAF